MPQMKSKKEIGHYISLKIKEKKMSQSDLADKIATMKGEGYEKSTINDNVSKWIRGERYPGTDYLYYLAQVLEVSVEEILVAGEVCEKYDTRPFTLYAVAKNKNRENVDILMANCESEPFSVGTNYDEYNKTLLDYILEFENLNLIHYIIEKKYVSFNGEFHTCFRTHERENEYFKKLLFIALKYDDIFIFKFIIKRTYEINADDAVKFFEQKEVTCNMNGYRKYLAKEIIENILNTKNILDYLITPFVPTDDEYEELNDDLKEMVKIPSSKKFETISGFFNYLLNVALMEQLAIAKNFTEIGRIHNEEVLKKINEIYNPIDYEIKNNGKVIMKNHPNIILTTLANPVNTIEDRKKMNCQLLMQESEIRVKNKEEMGKYLSLKIKERQMSQSDLAEKIAIMKGDKYKKNLIKDNVSKWIRGQRYPGTENIYYLSKALEVNVEEILVAGEGYKKYITRPFTLYAVAKSGNKSVLDKLMNESSDGYVLIGTSYDEYDNTLLDYLLEFENLELIHYILEKGYLRFYFEDINRNNCFSIYDAEKYFEKFLNLSIKYDDDIVFRYLIKRIFSIYIKDPEKKNSKISPSRLYGLPLKKATLIKILKTHKILHYLISPFTLSKEENYLLNERWFYQNIGEKDILPIIIETLSASFNLLLNLAIVENLDVAKVLIDIGERHNKKIGDQLKKNYDTNDYKIISDGSVIVNYQNKKITITRFAGLDDSIVDREKYQLLRL